MRVGLSARGIYKENNMTKVTDYKDVRVIKEPDADGLIETGLPLNRSILHEADVVAVKDVEVVPDTEAVKEAEHEHDAAVYALSREAAITGDTHIEVDGEVIPLVPEDMITEQDKVHADPAPTHRPNKEVKITAVKK